MLDKAKALGFEEVPPWDTEEWEDCDELVPWESCNTCNGWNGWWDVGERWHCLVCDPPIASLVKIGQAMIVGNTAGSDTSEQASFGLGLLKKLRSVGAVPSDFRAAPLAAEAERLRHEARQFARKGKAE